MIVLTWLNISSIASANSPKISIVWSTENYSNNDYILKDTNGDPLSAGIQGNGDGDLIELGYYSLATSGSPFEGDWVALTQKTHIGDSSTGYGFDNGKFAFSSTFTKDSNAVTIFPTEPKMFVETLDFIITSASPPPGTPICIRFYDSPIKTEISRYNAVTGASWTWPNFPSGSSIPSNYYWKIAEGSPPSGSYWKYGNTFEDSEHPFVASKSQTFRVGISLSTDSSGMGSITDINGTPISDFNSTFPAGSYIDINATIAAHHEFYMWTGGTFIEPHNPNTKVYVDGTLDIKAQIYPAIYYIGVPHDQESQIEGWGPQGYGSQVVLLSTPPAGYSFSHWEENSSIVSLANPFAFAVTGDRNLNAVYRPLTFDVSFSGNGGSIGSILDENGNAPTHYLYDHNYTLHLIPNTHYQFSEWHAETSSLATLTNPSGNPLEWQFSPDANASYEANFKVIENYLWIHTGIGGTTDLKTGMFLAIDENMPINATAQQGYKFSYWSDPSGILSELNSSSTEANISKIDISANITANFELLDYNLTDINITASEGGIHTLETVASGKYKHFSNYSLIATPLPGYQFDRWMGDGNLSNLAFDPSAATNEIIIDGPITLVASFVPSLYQLTTSSEPPGAGFVSGGGGFSILDSLAIEALPNPYWHFESWSGDTEFLVSTESSNSIIQWPHDSSPRDLNLTAHFSKQTINLDASTNGQGSLRYSISNNDEVIQSSDSATFISTELFAEDHLIIEGIPSPGWEFKNWTGLPRTDDLISSDIIETYLEVASFSSSVDINVSANFIRSEFALTITNSSQGGESTGSGAYPYEEFVEINATPKPHFTFNGWTGSGIEYLEFPTTSIHNALYIPLGDTELTAVFEPIPYSLNVGPHNHGNVSHIATYNENNHSNEEISGTSKVTVTATPDEGYVLSSWVWEKSDGTTGTSYSNPFIINFMDSNYSISPNFAPAPSNLDYSLRSNLPEAGVTEEIFPLATLAQRTFSAESFTGYSFLGWTTDQSVQLSPLWSSHLIDVNISNGTNITANYRKDDLELLLEYDSQRGMIDWNQSLSSTHHDSLKAIPRDNYEFKSWELTKKFHFTVDRGYSEIKLGESRLFINGKESPELTLIRGFSYTFELNLEPEDNFFFTESSSESLDQSYLLGVSNNRSSQGTVTFNVPEECPDFLFYNGSLFSHSGNKVKILSLDESELIPYPKNSSINIQLPADLELKAEFAPVELDFQISQIGEGHIATQADNVFYGDQISLTASPSEHWVFSHWEGNLNLMEPQNPNIEIEILKDTEVIANFKRKIYKLEIHSSPADFGSSFSTNSIYNYNHGDIVNIKANARDGKVFSHWSSPVPNNRQSHSETFFQLEEDTVLTAHFDNIEFNMSYNVVVLDQDSVILPDEFGGFVVADHTYLDEELANFNFILNQGYDFISWKDADNNETLSHASSFNLEIDRNLNLEIFVQKKSHQVLLSNVPSQKGKISLNNSDFNDTTNFSVNHNEVLQLFATPYEGYVFQKWVSFSGLLPFPNNRSLTYTVKEDSHIAAYFIPLEDVELKILIEPSNSGWVSGEGTFAYNSKHTISASPKSGWIFDRWIGNGVENKLLRSTTLNLNEDKTIIAQFKENPDTGNNIDPTLNVLLVTSQDSERGEVSGSGIYLTDWTPINAVPSPGYDFSHWAGENVENMFASSTRTYTDKSKQIIAHFIRSGIFTNSTSLIDAWWSNPWFGNFWKKRNNNWIFHQKIGWCYISVLEDSSIWFWKEGPNSWFWTSETTFPYIKSESEGWHWINLDRSKANNNLLLYRFQSPEGWLAY